MVELITRENAEGFLKEPSKEFSYTHATAVIGSLLGHENDPCIQPSLLVSEVEPHGTVHASGPNELIPTRELNVANRPELERMTTYEACLSGLRLLNAEMHLGMDEKDLKMISLLHTAMYYHARRFAGEDMLDTNAGENSAVHSQQCVALLAKLFKDSGAELNYESARARQLAALTLLIHDGGEALGEELSLSGAVKSGVPKDEKQESERKILQFVLTKAEESIDKGDIQGFFDTIGKKYDMIHDYISSEEALANPELRVGDFKSLHLDEESVDRALGEEPKRSERVQTWMDLWHMSEYAGKEWLNERFESDYMQGLVQEHEQLPTFIGMMLKSVEHMQGTRHLLRFKNKLGITANDKMVHANIQYVESEIPPLFRLSKALEDHPIADTAEAMSRACAKKCYSTLADFHRIFNPENDVLPATTAYGPTEVVQARIRQGDAMGRKAGMYSNAARGIDEGFTPTGLLHETHQNEFMPNLLDQRISELRATSVGRGGSRSLA